MNAPRLSLCSLPLALAAVGLVGLAGCVGPDDDPTTVKDLRVLGVAFEPPELMAPVCRQDASSFATWGAPVKLNALIADPKGEGRALSYEVFACADAADKRCEKAEERVLLTSGSTTTGELGPLTLRPGFAALDDGSLLVEKVVDADPYRGLGGVRMPIVLHVTAGNEEIWAQKLMVLSCKLFPQMKQNATPRLTSFNLNDSPWGGGLFPDLLGEGPWTFTADTVPFEEAYTVPNFQLKPVELTESWKIAWHTDYGRFTQYETGGTDFGGGDGRHVLEWRPPADPEAREVTFWAVVRDGRGGLSWLIRRARFQP